MNTKICTRCKVEKSWDEYYKLTNGKPRSKCKACYYIGKKNDDFDAPKVAKTCVACQKSYFGRGRRYCSTECYESHGRGRRNYSDEILRHPETGEALYPLHDVAEELGTSFLGLKSFCNRHPELVYVVENPENGYKVYYMSAANMQRMPIFIQSLTEYKVTWVTEEEYEDNQDTLPLSVLDDIEKNKHLIDAVNAKRERRLEKLLDEYKAKNPETEEEPNDPTERELRSVYSDWVQEWLGVAASLRLE